MKKYLVSSIALVLGIVISGCALFQNFDKRDVAYNAGFLGTQAYLKNLGNISNEEQAMVNQVWKAYDEAVNKIPANMNPKDFPVYIKGYIAQSPIPPSMKDKANGLVDTYWAKMNEKFSVESLNITEFVAVLVALRDGIKAAISITNVKEAKK